MGPHPSRIHGRNTLFPAALLTFAVVIAPQAGWAQPSPGELPRSQEKVPDTFFERIALADGFSRLMTGLLDLPLTDRRPLGRWVGTHRGLLEMELRRVVHENLQEVPARRLPDGTVEVDVWVPLPRVSKSLAELAERLPGVRDDRGWPGFAASHEGKPLGTVVRATGSSNQPHSPAVDAPAGWEHCSARQLSLAARAARIDALAQLMAKIRGARLSVDRSLGRVLDEHPAFDTSVRERLAELPAKAAQYEPFGVCRQALSAERVGVIELLQLALVRVPAGSRPKDLDLTRIVLPDVIAVQGLSIAPHSSGVEVNATAPLPKPAGPSWVTETLTATGVAEPPEDAASAAAARTLAVKVARVDAVRQLLLEVDRLSVGAGLTVGELIEARPELIDLVDAFEQTIQPAGTPRSAPDGRVSVTVSASLDRLWSALSPHVPPRGPPTSRPTFLPASASP